MVAIDVLWLIRRKNKILLCGFWALGRPRTTSLQSTESRVGRLVVSLTLDSADLSSLAMRRIVMVGTIWDNLGTQYFAELCYGLWARMTYGPLARTTEVKVWCACLLMYRYCTEYKFICIIAWILFSSCNFIFVHFPSLYHWPLTSTRLCTLALSGRTGNVTIRHITTSALFHMLVLVLSAPSRAFGNCQEFYGVRIWRFAILRFLHL